MLWGEKGVGKTYAMDSSARCLTGLGEEDKVNQLIDVRALLHKAAYTTQPITLEDNESRRKEEVLAVAIFDKQVPNAV